MSTELTNKGNELIKTEEFTNVMKSAPGILERNELAVTNCNNAGQALIDTIDSLGGINSDELDAKIADYIEKAKITTKNMNDRRSPITQLLTAVSKRFTTLEAVIDIKSPATIPYKLQDARNKYAARKLEEQKKREAEARRLQAVENEKAGYKSDISVLLDTVYGTYIESHINAVNDMYDRVTLENYNEQSALIKQSFPAFDWADYASKVKDTVTTFHIDEETKKTIKNEVARVKKDEFTKRYSFEMDDLKQALTDKLPSRRKELEELAILSKQNAEEAARKAEEAKAREAEERKKAEEERKRQEEAAKQQAAAERATAEVQSAFNFGMSVAPGTALKAKVTKKIEVTNPQGFMLIYQLWFTKEGINLPAGELEKVHKKMITFCEKEANKDGGEQIKSPLINYVDDVKAK